MCENYINSKISSFSNLTFFLFKFESFSLLYQIGSKTDDANHFSLSPKISSILFLSKPQIGQESIFLSAKKAKTFPKAK